MKRYAIIQAFLCMTMHDFNLHNFMQSFFICEPFEDVRNRSCCPYYINHRVNNKPFPRLKDGAINFLWTLPSQNLGCQIVALLKSLFHLNSKCDFVGTLGEIGQNVTTLFVTTCDYYLFATTFGHFCNYFLCWSYLWLHYN